MIWWLNLIKHCLAHRWPTGSYYDDGDDGFLYLLCSTIWIVIMSCYLLPHSDVKKLHLWRILYIQFFFINIYIFFVYICMCIQTISSIYRRRQIVWWKSIIHHPVSSLINSWTIFFIHSPPILPPTLFYLKQILNITSFHF